MKPPGVGLLKQSSPILRGVMFKQMWKQQQASVLISYVLPYSVHQKKKTQAHFYLTYFITIYTSLPSYIVYEYIAPNTMFRQTLSIKRCQILVSNSTQINFEIYASFMRSLHTKIVLQVVA